MDRDRNSETISPLNDNHEDFQQIQLDSLQVNIPQTCESLDSSDEDTDDDFGGNCITTCSCIFTCRREFKIFFTRHSATLKTVVLLVIMCLYIVYFSYAMYLHHQDSSVIGLIIITVILTLVFFVKCVPYQRSLAGFQQLLNRHPRVVKNSKRFVAATCTLIACITIITEVILVRPSNLISLAGIASILAVFLITSTHPHKIQWRPVISGLFLQYLFALIIFKVPAVNSILRWCGAMVNTILSFSRDGEIFLYGSDFKYAGFIFQLVPLVVFVICMLTVLEHLMVLHAVLRVLGRILAFCIGSSPAEAFNASANIFLGPIDSLVIIRPFLENITPSELHCLMANGMSTVTGSIMGLYVLLGVTPFNYSFMSLSFLYSFLIGKLKILSGEMQQASVMSAPAALSLSKLSVPETRKHPTDPLMDVLFVSKYRSVMDAASSGAIAAMTLIAAIVSNVTAVIGAIKMVNYTLNWLGELVNFKGLTMQWICSYLFYPLALGLGVDMQDGLRVAELIGVKAFINEIVSYSILGQYRSNRIKFEEYTSLNYTDWSTDSDTNDITLPGWNLTLVGGFLTERSEVITTYALCGFANFVSVGIMMGCYLALVPHRRATIFKYILRAMMVGHCASFITACIAGEYVNLCLGQTGAMQY